MTEVNTAGNMSATNIFVQIGHWLLRLNIYHDKPLLTVREQLLATRLNLSGLILSLFILIVVRTFTPQTTMIIIDFPSETQFEQLNDRFPSTLSCPCTQVTFPYQTFLSFAPQYHQVCSSDLISSSWISTLFSTNTSRYHPLDFRNGASSQFQILALLCSLAVKSVSNALTGFGRQKLISSHVEPQVLLNARTKALTTRLQTTTTADILRMNQFLALIISDNRLESILQTNYLEYSVPGSRAYFTYTASYIKENSTNMADANSYCSCDLIPDCSYPSGFYSQTVRTSNYYTPVPPALFVVPGMFTGCVPSSSILQSTLECFYDSSCLDTLASLGIDTFHLRPLNVSVPSRFSINASIESVFKELFIEDLFSRSSFSNYFRTCAPMACSYTYSDQINIISTLATIISLLSGLIVVFHFLAYFVVLHIFRRVCRIRGYSIPGGQQPQSAVGRQSKWEFPSKW